MYSVFKLLCIYLFLEPPACQTPVDLAFIVDSSGSIGSKNYLKEKHFIKQLARSFGVAPGQSRAALVLYSNSASVKAGFDQYPTLEQFHKSVDDLPYEKGFTRIDLALQKANQEVFPQARKGVPKIAILITDGKQTKTADSKGLREASEPLRRAGVRVLAVGVGSGVDSDELRLVTESDDDVVVAQSFPDLLVQIGNLTSRACELAEPPACQTPVDLAFIVDSSGSIGSKNYLKEKHFIKQLARSFGVAPGQSRAALVLYSNSASVKAGFDQYPTLEQFHKSVDDLPYEKGFTRIDLALQKANQEVFPQARKGVPKIAILITDGKQTKTADSKGLREASEPLRRAGVRVLAVGVGSGVDSDELRLVTESDDDVVVAQSFPDLLVQIGNLTSRACELAEPPACQTPVDLAFIVDSSGSIGSKNYLKEKHFIKQLARSFGVAPGQSRAALVLYSNSASVKAGFDQYPTLEQFHKSVDDLPYEKGFTRIDLALQKANQEVFPQARKGVPKIAILITDGKQTKTADSKGLREASEPLRRAGVRVLAVGVGSGVDSDELRLVTESDDDVVVAQSFPDLLVQIGNLTSRACELAGECKKPPACQTPVDLAFIVDSSGSIGSKNYLKEKHFIKQLARSFGVAPGQSRAALVLYSNSASVKAGFDQYPTLEQFHKSVDDLPYEKGFTRIDLALQKANQEVFPQARKGVPKIAILITDGKQTKTADSKGLREASEPLRRAGVRVLAVGVGSGVDSDELRLVTESDDDVVVAQSFPDLLVQIGNLTSRACELAGECKSAHLGGSGLQSGSLLAQE
ncbi:collagen alpha-4(VI) chain-like [Acropora muricata]|uniref:collagen alpha-4(VI) chain-like n=1 Tax=Acropora muricata TaxID=159855 RepID=UPI0034E429EB